MHSFICSWSTSGLYSCNHLGSVETAVLLCFSKGLRLVLAAHILGFLSALKFHYISWSMSTSQCLFTNFLFLLRRKQHTPWGQDSSCLNIMATLPSQTFGSTNYKKPNAIYNGGYENAKTQGVRLRIASGSAGQTGLIGAWADGFIQHMVSEGVPPFEVCPSLDTVTGKI